MTDYEIYNMIEKSQDEGFNALFEQYKKYVYTIVWNTIRKNATYEDAEECVSDIFANVFLNYKEMEIGSYKAYIGTVAKRMSVNYFRKITSENKYYSESSEIFNSASSDENIELNTEISEMNRILYNRIQKLGEPDSTIVIQRYYYKRKSNDIAKQVNLSPVSVRVRLNRSLKKLKKMLIDDGIV